MYLFLFETLYILFNLCHPTPFCWLIQIFDENLFVSAHVVLDARVELEKKNSVFTFFDCLRTAFLFTTISMSKTCKLIQMLEEHLFAFNLICQLKCSLLLEFSDSGERGNVCRCRPFSEIAIRVVEIRQMKYTDVYVVCKVAWILWTEHKINKTSYTYLLNK